MKDFRGLKSLGREQDLCDGPRSTEFMPIVWCKNTNGASHFQTTSREILEKKYMNIWEHKQESYLVISNYYSQVLDTFHLPSTTTTQIKQKLKLAFRNNKRFKTARLQDLHINCHHTQGNSHSKRAVQSVRKILRCSNDL